MDRSQVEMEIARLARAQHGVFSHIQALRVGATQPFIRHRLETGRWVTITSKVYALASAPATWKRQLMAAVVSRPRAFVSGPAAAALHTFPGFRPGRPEITVPRTGNARLDIARVRRSQHYFAIRRVDVDGIPTASPAETVFGLLPAAPYEVVEAAAEHCLVTGMAAEAEFRAIAARHTGEHLRGMKTYRAVVDALCEEHPVPESPAEALLHRCLRHPDIPPFETQVDLPWWEGRPFRVDVLIRLWRLILEADGRTWHMRRADFERDRARDNLAAVHGYRVLRFSYRMLATAPDRVQALILAAGGATAAV